MIIVMLLLIGAAAQVSQEEFQALTGRVEWLEVEVKGLKWQVSQLTKALRPADLVELKTPEPEERGDAITVDDLSPPQRATETAFDEWMTQKTAWEEGLKGKLLRASGVVTAVYGKAPSFNVVAVHEKKKGNITYTYTFLMTTGSLQALSVKLSQRIEFEGQVEGCDFQRLRELVPVEDKGTIRETMAERYAITVRLSNIKLSTS